MTVFNSRKVWGYHDDQIVTTHPISGYIADTEAAESIFDGITYSKGAAVLKQLMYIITEEKFSQALKTYFCKFEWKNAVLDDFIEVMQQYFQNQHFTLR
jgi:aminopeptidase N